MAEVIHLTGVEQAHDYLAKARTAQTWEAEDAWLRLHAKFMRRTNRDDLALAFGDAEDEAEIRRAHVGA